MCMFFSSLRNQLNSLQEASGGKRISVNDLVIKVVDIACMGVYHLDMQCFY